MIHFSSRVSASSSIEVDPMLPISDFVRILLIAMDVNSVQDSTPAEERVVKGFVRWFRKLEKNSRDGVLFVDPIFVYVNLNAGFTSVFVATDPKGKITF